MRTAKQQVFYSLDQAVRARLLSYAKERQISLNGICRHVYLEGPPQHKDPRNFITMVALLLDESGQ